MRDSVGHLHYFSKDTALALLKDCGFQVENHFYTNGADGVYAGKMFRLMKFPRKLAFACNPDSAVRFLGGYSLMVHCSVRH